MEELFRFIMKRSKFLMFLALEIIAFILIFNENEFQKSTFLRQTASISAKFYNITTTIGNYFQLSNTNEDLAAENNRLKNELEQLLYERSLLKQDSLIPTLGTSDIHYINAKVVYSSIYKLQNYIILNKGSKDGIMADMGVVNNEKVVGVVQYSTEHYAVVLPLINITQRISAKIKRDNQLGTIVWDGVNSQVVEFEEIPRHASPVVGDSIVTSGFSAIFPEGYLIGTIKSAECSPSDAFYDIKVSLATNFNTLTYVSVVVFDTKEEINTILKELPDER